MPNEWSQLENKAVVSAYLDMLETELAGIPYSKASHNRKLRGRLKNRSKQSIEFKHANISAVLINSGFQYIPGYKPRFNYQRRLVDVVSEMLAASPKLLKLAAEDADLPMVMPEVKDILSILTTLPAPSSREPLASTAQAFRPTFAVNYLEREARNRSLGAAGEEFVLNYERARLMSIRRDDLAEKIVHTSRVYGDAQGYDILSFDATGTERFIEVKATKYGRETPFFVSRNEVAVSELRASQYHLYRLFEFRATPQLFTLKGALSTTCRLSASTFLASVQ